MTPTPNESMRHTARGLASVIQTLSELPRMVAEELAELERTAKPEPTAPKPEPLPGCEFPACFRGHLVEEVYGTGFRKCDHCGWKTMSRVPEPTTAACPDCGTICEVEAADPARIKRARELGLPVVLATGRCPKCAPARTCSVVDETAPVPDYGPPALHFPWVAIHHDELNALRAEVERLDAMIEGARIAAGVGKGGDLVECIKDMHRRLAHLQFGPEAAARQGWPEALKAEGAREERERIIAILASEGHSSRSIWRDAARGVICFEETALRAALEPKPEAPYGR